ncbi:MAG: hypothetical protein K0R58_4253, partial [Ramlibacter sp.]|nr:hypothetical protein [Ramlibacter sp.]
MKPSTVIASTAVLLAGLAGPSIAAPS